MQRTVVSPASTTMAAAAATLYAATLGLVLGRRSSLIVAAGMELGDSSAWSSCASGSPAWQRLWLAMPIGLGREQWQSQ